MTDSNAIDEMAQATQRKVLAVQRAGQAIGIGVMLAIGLATFVLLPNEGKIGEYRFLIACGAGLAAFFVCALIARARINSLVRDFQTTAGLEV